MRRAVTLAASLLLAGGQAAGTFDAQRASAEIASDLARRDTDAAASAASRLMETTSVSKLKDAFDFARDLGRGEYADLVYMREYGHAEQDIIYKVDFEKAFLFVRFLYHVDNGAWRLVHIDLKTENELPFPKGWTHIYPK